MECPNCKGEVCDEDERCVFCGANLAAIRENQRGAKRGKRQMKLSPEEKSRIHEEEKIRLEAQDEVEKEKAKKKSESAGKVGLGCLILVAVLVMIGVAIGVCSNSSTDNGGTDKTLNAMVSVLDGVQLEIHNNDSFDWTNLTLTVNSSYTLTEYRMAANTTYTVGLAQFTKGDGTRFNPFTQKPLELLIYCDEGNYGCTWSR